ncbi:MAG: SRPBCC domain-containing protein [Bacteroidota bacterium]
MRSHRHEEILPASPADVFRLLHTPSAIRDWWGATQVIVHPERGGTWCAAWGADEDNPDYISAATIETFEPAVRMRLSSYSYHTKTEALPFEADFSVDFRLSPHPDGTVLSVTQAGFPDTADADSFLKDCKKGWADTFANIRRHLVAQPV